MVSGSVDLNWRQVGKKRKDMTDYQDNHRFVYTQNQVVIYLHEPNNHENYMNMILKWNLISAWIQMVVQSSPFLTVKAATNNFFHYNRIVVD